MSVAQRDVVITGMGAVCIVEGEDSLDQSLLGWLATRQSYIHIEASQVAPGPRVEQAVQVATRLAMDSAGINPPYPAIGLLVGSALSSYHWVLESLDTIKRKGRPTVQESIYCEANTPASLLTTKLGLGGINITFTTGKIAGLQALQHGYNIVQWGHEDILLVASCDVPINRQSTHPAWGATMVIESVERAVGRGCTPLAQIKGGIVLSTDLDTILVTNCCRESLDKPVMWYEDEQIDCGAVAPFFTLCQFLHADSQRDPSLTAVMLDEDMLASLTVARWSD